MSFEGVDGKFSGSHGCMGRRDPPSGSLRAALSAIFMQLLEQVLGRSGFGGCAVLASRAPG